MEKIALLGLGNVGALAGVLLKEAGFSPVGFDKTLPVAKQPYETIELDLSDKAQVKTALRRFDAVLSALPYALNPLIAEVAHEDGLHYFDLTEDVSVTAKVKELSKTSKTLMAPQCGLAPGFIAIAASHLARKFETIRAIRMRVGALPQHPTGLLGYAFNWSPEGVVNEYLNDCEVIEEGQHKWVSPMEWLETLYVNGQKYEAFTTSGGLGTMCETYLNHVENLDYKSIRYPGHAQQMNFFFHELLMREHREQAGAILTKAKPKVDDDVVIIHTSVEGQMEGRLHRQEYVRSYYPKLLAGKSRRAIAWTTAASVCGVIEMVAKGQLPSHGFIKQEEISLDKFLATNSGALYREER
ncbi:Saccharopine dehydrogenase [Candidatus Terasakiella magnetica]|uniref:Saccharopine dehydrogenase n=1 Tax=Candidatus Terasakiella magnetica TaxID=1867952 RepID=A0A1C3RJU7_9PROT|nr:saccharopine dehydrogenase C-terminal domain-containing protein [Candidatus Terasakiella magnetica]SCA57503.1 Saccharopine dehydrogenase [Candidatus Terasakiella magnetica]